MDASYEIWRHAVEMTEGWPVPTPTAPARGGFCPDCGVDCPTGQQCPACGVGVAI